MGGGGSSGRGLRRWRRSKGLCSAREDGIARGEEEKKCEPVQWQFSGIM